MSAFFLFQFLTIWFDIFCRKFTRKHESSRSYHNTKRLLQRMRQTHCRPSDHCIGPHLASRALHMQPLLPRAWHAQLFRARRSSILWVVRYFCVGWFTKWNLCWFFFLGNFVLISSIGEPDYHNLFSPRCAYCNGAILDKCVTALDKTWHTEHVSTFDLTKFSFWI